MGSLMRKVLLLVGLLVIAISIYAFFIVSRDEKRLALAESSYSQAVNAATLYEREMKFNEALNFYLSLENEYHPVFGDGKLFYNLGNVFYQLGQYPRAILYYEKALALRPRDVTVQKNLNQVMQKLNLSVRSNYFSVSLPERLQIFFFLGSLLIICISWGMWGGKKWVERGAIVVFLALGLVGSSLIYTRYFAPIEAIVLNPTELRRDAGTQYVKVTRAPIPAGTKVEVLGISPTGLWLKLITPEGQVGYATQASLQVI